MGAKVKSINYLQWPGSPCSALYKKIFTNPVDRFLSKRIMILYKYDQVLASRVTKPFEQSTFGKMSRSQEILSTYFPKNLLPNLAVGVFSAKNQAKTAENWALSSSVTQKKSLWAVEHLTKKCHTNFGWAVGRISTPIKNSIAEAPSGTCHSLLYRHRADS